MANTDQFNLKLAIDDWTFRLKEKGLSPERVSELESHMNDVLDDLDSARLSEKEQFIIAMYSMGSIETLKKAYDYQSPFNFQRFSDIAQAIAYFIIFRMLSGAAITSTNSIFIWTESNNQVLYLGISFIFQAIAFALVYLTYTTVTRSKQRNQREFKSNAITLSGIVLSIVVYIGGLYFLKPSVSPLAVFPFLQSVFSYLIPAVFFLSLLFKTMIEWKKEKKIRVIV